MPAQRDQGDTHAPSEPAGTSHVMTLDLEPSTAHERRFEPHAVELFGVGCIVLTSAGQANEILVGVVVWH
jgi:hypothetical protein